MPRDFYPRPEADIVRWTGNFSQRINAAPQDFALTEEQASSYAIVQQAFSEAFYIVRSPSTNSSSAGIARDGARVALEAATRQLVKIVKAQPTVTDEIRVTLGLPPRPVRRGHVPAPDAAPILRVVGTIGSVVQIRLVDATSTRPGKPRDVRGAVVFGYVGENPPTSRDGWKLKGMTTRATTEVRFDASLPPGMKVWLTAYWTNAREEKGPSCAPVYTHLQYGVALQPRGLPKAA